MIYSIGINHQALLEAQETHAVGAGTMPDRLTETSSPVSRRLMKSTGDGGDFSVVFLDKFARTAAVLIYVEEFYVEASRHLADGVQVAFDRSRAEDRDLGLNGGDGDDRPNSRPRRSRSCANIWSLRFRRRKFRRFEGASGK
jgi:hypothetical protein